MKELEKYEKEKRKFWLHFIGSYYYSISKFSKEAKRYGVSRRISLNLLKKMDWGDIVLLAQGNRKNSAKIFGYFKISNITAQGLLQKCPDLIMNFEATGGNLIKRQCGEYYVTGIALVKKDVKVSEIAERLEKVDKAMIGGDLVLLEKPITVKLLTFQQGFRRFDIKKFLEDLKNGKPKGQYYIHKKSREQVLEELEGKDPLEIALKDPAPIAVCIEDYKKRD